MYLDTMSTTDAMQYDTIHTSIEMQCDSIQYDVMDNAKE